MAQLEILLEKYGLGSLAPWAMDQIIAGNNADQIIQSLREQPAYLERFQAIKLRQDAGLPAMSEAEVIEYEERSRELMRLYGLPVGFYDSHTDFAAMIGEDVGIPELESRITLARNAAENATIGIQAELTDMYGVGLGGLTAYYLDPDKALPILERQYAAAEIKAEAADFTRATGRAVGLGVEAAEELVREGVDREAAAEAFSTLEAGSELLGDLAGGVGTPGWTEEDFQSFLGGDVATQKRLAQTARGRVASHRGEATGGFGRTESGGYAVGAAS
jgi:hypothetical protein